MDIVIMAVLSILALWCAIMMVRWDLKSRLIPDVFLFPFLLIGLLMCDKFPWITGGIGESVVAAAIGYAVGFVINLIFKLAKKQADDYDPIGMGDIKLLAAGGVWLGMTGLSIAIIVSCILGVIWAVVKKQRFVPFAPFFFIGAVVAIVLSSVHGG